MSARKKKNKPQEERTLFQACIFQGLLLLVFGSVAVVPFVFDF